MSTKTPQPQRVLSAPSNVTTVPDIVASFRARDLFAVDPVTPAELRTLRDACALDQTRLSKAFCELPSEFAQWNERLTAAYRAKLLADAELDRTKAARRIYWREVQSLEGLRPTEGTVTDALEADPAYLTARITWIEAEAAYQQARGVLNTLAAKKDMLVSLGAHMRAELNAPEAMHRIPAGYTNDHSE